MSVTFGSRRALSTPTGAKTLTSFAVHLGRLLLPIYSGGPYAVYSDDHGASWRAGEILNHTAGVETTGAGEWAIAETGAYGVDGTPLLLGSRRNSPKTPAVVPGSGKGHRLQALSATRV